MTQREREKIIKIKFFYAWLKNWYMQHLKKREIDWSIQMCDRKLHMFNWKNKKKKNVKLKCNTSNQKQLKT
jgi:hypothetical protein